MNQNQIKDFYNVCDSLDIRRLRTIELDELFGCLKKEILIGLKRKGEKKIEDGGLEAIDTEIKPISYSQLEKVPVNTQVIYGAYAGTNWITGVAVKLEKKVSEQKLVTKTFINKKNRIFQTTDLFAEMICGQIIEAASLINDPKSISTLAISFGFPQIPKNTLYGRDALLSSDRLTKSWHIHGGAQTLVGEKLLSKLKEKGFGFIKNIYFANDTTAVALDVSAKFDSNKGESLVSLPIGFVMGTGDNGSAVFTGYKKNHLINLEIGSAVGFGSDMVMKKMIEDNLLPTSFSVIEYYMGGDYLLARLSTALEMLFLQKITKVNFGEKLQKYAKEAKITSKLAGKELSAEELSELLNTKVNADDVFVLNEVAMRILLKGAQIAGCMVASVCDLAGWGKGIYGAIPVEGTVFTQAFKFRETVRKTLKTLLPHHKLTFVPGSGTRGISTEAMIQRFKCF